MNNKGFSFIEIVVGVSIILVGIVSVLGSYNFLFKVSQNNLKMTKAEFLLEEGAEAIKSIRDTGWSNISGLEVDHDYHLEFGISGWHAVETDELIDGIFERKFRIEDVYRDDSDNIAESGSLDPLTKKAVIVVSWKEGDRIVERNLEIIIVDLL